jgi:hypothetical protein
MNNKAFISKLKTINLGSAPPWAEPLKDLGKMVDNPDANTKIFEESQRLKKMYTRERKWAAWEKDRKNAAMKNKPEWIKRGALPHERDAAINV